MIDFSKRPHPSWQRSLARIAPRSEVLNWLHLGWYAGDLWCPVERWIVYEMTPFSAVARQQALAQRFGFEDEFYRALTGPNPRTGGHYDAALGCFLHKGPPPLIDRRQWVLFRELGAFARPVWVVQGDRGGHKRHFSPLEIRHLRTQGYPYDEAPAPGELPYADFDERVVDQLARMDQLRKWDRRRAWTRRTIGDQWRARAKAETEFLRLFGAWLDQQLAGVASIVADMVRTEDLPYNDTPVEEREQAYLDFEEAPTLTEAEPVF